MQTEALIRTFLSSLERPNSLDQRQWELLLQRLEPVVRRRVHAWAKAKCPQPWSTQWGYMFALLRGGDGRWAPCHVRRRCRLSEPSKYEYAVVVSIQHESGQLPMFMQSRATPETLEYVWLEQWFTDADQAKIAFTLSHTLAMVAFQEEQGSVEIVNEARTWAQSHHLSLHGNVARLWESSQSDYAGPDFTAQMAYAFVEALELEQQYSERVIKDSMRCQLKVDVLMNGTEVSQGLTPEQANALHQITPVLVGAGERLWEQLTIKNHFTWRELMFLCETSRYWEYHETSQGDADWVWPSISLHDVLEAELIRFQAEVADVATILFKHIRWPATVRVRFVVTFAHDTKSLIRYRQMLTHTLALEGAQPSSNWSLQYDSKGGLPSMVVVDPSLDLFFIDGWPGNQSQHQHNALYALLRAPEFVTGAGTCVRLDLGETQKRKKRVSQDVPHIKAFWASCFSVSHAELQNYYLLDTHWPRFLDPTTATCLWRRIESGSDVYPLEPWQIEWPMRWPTNPQSKRRMSRYVLRDEFDPTQVEQLYAPLVQGVCRNECSSRGASEPCTGSGAEPLCACTVWSIRSGIGNAGAVERAFRNNGETHAIHCQSLGAVWSTPPTWLLLFACGPRTVRLRAARAAARDSPPACASEAGRASGGQTRRNGA